MCPTTPRGTGGVPAAVPTCHHHIPGAILAALAILVLAGCREDGNDDDTTVDSVVDDTEVDTGDASDLEDPGDTTPDPDVPDGDDPDADDPDAGDATDAFDAPDGTMGPTPPAEILQTGTGGYLLRGVVLTPTGILDPGEVLVVDEMITCVAADCTGETGAGDATWIETHGIISPGLVDAHNHLAYNFLPEWYPPSGTLYQNRYEWADEPSYEEHIEPYAAHRSTGTHYCPAAKWGELRSIIHGTTTVQGQSFNQGCVDWGVRNADHHHNLDYDHMRTTIASVRDITDTDAAGLIEDFDAAVNPTTRYAVHMAEGYAGDHVDEEFDSFAGRDPRTNRHNGTSLLYNGTALLIHCVPLTEEQLIEVRDTESKVVWSPSSNIVLYDVTAPIQRILQLGITTAIAPDWTPSGEDEMLAEMRYGYQYGLDNAIPELTTEQIWRMSTLDAAEAVGLQDWVGRLEPGYVADITVFGMDGPDPYLALMESRADDVRLVMIGGEGYYGDLDLQDATARNDQCESFLPCSIDKYLCVVDPEVSSRGDETLEDIETQLYNIMEGIGYPPEEQYGRGDELLPLVDCSI